MKSRRLVLWLGSAALVLLAAAATTPAFALGTRAGTAITNQATVNFTDANGNPGSALSNVVTTTVSQVAGVTVDPDGNQNGVPGSTLYFPHLVTNTGNFDDTVNLAATSAAGWSVALYRDVNGNQAYDAGTDTLLADSNGDTIPDSGLLANVGSMRILVAVTIPVGSAHAASDTRAGGSCRSRVLVEELHQNTPIASAFLSKLPLEIAQYPCYHIIMIQSFKD